MYRRKLIANYASLNIAHLVVISDLYILWTRCGPSEANAILSVDSDSVLSCAVMYQRVEFISWRRSKVLQSSCRIQHV